jgi:site-specific recombinase XerD
VAYYRAVNGFLQWCEQRGISLAEVEPMLVAAYVEQLQLRVSPPTVKQHLSAVRMLFDWLVIGQIVPVNPASSVRGPKYIVKKGQDARPLRS